MSMNDYLQNMVYGADQATMEDLTVEKLAQAQIVEDLLLKESGDQMSLENLSIPELYKVAAELFGEDSVLAIETAAAWEKIAKEEEEEEDDEEDEEKTAELHKIAENADASGRIMAHAFVDELNAMNKEASVASMARGAASKAYGAARSGAGKAYGAVGRAGGALRDAATAKRLRKGMKQRSAVRGASDAVRNATLPQARKNIMRGAAQTGALYGAGAGGTAYGVSKMRGKKKEASLLDILAESRLEQELQKQASFEDLINQRAFEIAAEYGLE